MRLPATLALCTALIFAPLTPLIAQEPAAPDALPRVDQLTPAQQTELNSLLELAEVRFNEGDYGRSLQYLQDAYKLFPHPALLYQLGLCYERLGKFEQARDHYTRFLTALPNAPEAPQARSALDGLASRDVKKPVFRTALRVESSPPGAVVYINDVVNGRAGTTPTADLPLPPGRYKIIIERDGFATHEEVVDLVDGQPAVVRVSLTRTAPPPEPERSASSAAPWVLLGVGGLGVGSAITFAVLSGDQGISSNKQDTYQTVALISGGVAVVAIGAALVLFLTDGQPTELGATTLPAPKAGDWTPSVWTAPGAGGAAFTLHF
jgi:hypothetical protein